MINHNPFPYSRAWWMARKGIGSLVAFIAVSCGLFVAIIDRAVVETLPLVTAADGGIDLGAAGITAPSSTWTYLVNDDPFRNQVLLKLIGPGGTTIAIYSSALLGPLFLLWGIVDRFLRKARRRRGDPFRDS